MNIVNPEYENLINSLIKDGYLKTPAIIEAFKNIDRVDFVLEEHKTDAYINAPLPIGFNQTISQPLTVAFMLELLEPKPDEKILDIGAGSGWQTTLLAYIVSKSIENISVNQRAHQRQSALVIAVERLPKLKEMAEKNIAKYNFIKKGIVQVISVDGSKGYKKEAPYDKIIAGAAAQGDVPIYWRRQLKIGGRIVAPVGNSVIVIDKVGRNKYNQREYFGFSFVPLITNDQQLTTNF
jgi:protein-L-isoaspartate(D-aspartate) O-methyltransferase